MVQHRPTGARQGGPVERKTRLGAGGRRPATTRGQARAAVGRCRDPSGTRRRPARCSSSRPVWAAAFARYGRFRPSLPNWPGDGAADGGPSSPRRPWPSRPEIRLRAGFPGIEELRQNADSLLIINNENILEICWAPFAQAGFRQGRQHSGLGGQRALPDHHRRERS